jgi:hypothetical protein
VLFIAGMGRSGSTLLDRLLGACDGICAVGELRSIWRLGFIEDQYCGCGERFSACPFWRDVVIEALGDPSTVDAARLDREQEDLLRLRNLPGIIGGAPSPARRAVACRAFRDLHARLYRAIRNVSGARVVADSSKNPVYGLLLRGTPGIELRTVHLVRDSRAVVASLARPARDPAVEGRRAYRYQRGAAVGSVNWLAMNALTAAIFPRGPKTVRLRYEDVAADPRRAVRRVLRLLGEGGAPPAPRTDGTFDLGVQHTLAGNPMRMEQGPIAIRVDERWREELAPGARALTTALTWPLLLRYGYRLRTR